MFENGYVGTVLLFNFVTGVENWNKPKCYEVTQNPKFHKMYNEASIPGNFKSNPLKVFQYMQEHFDIEPLNYVKHNTLSAQYRYVIKQHFMI